MSKSRISPDLWNFKMAILRSLNNPLDVLPTLSPMLSIALPSKASVAGTAAQMARFERDEAELETVRQSRPIGLPAIQDEPKSIHSPSPPARVRWQGPTPKGTGPRKRFAVQ